MVSFPSNHLVNSDLVVPPAASVKAWMVELNLESKDVVARLCKNPLNNFEHEYWKSELEAFMNSFNKGYVHLNKRLAIGLAEIFDVPIEHVLCLEPANYASGEYYSLTTM